jgi:DNA polymerase I-like protein with 3'-5' exonuclease and polymerase domains
MIGCKACSGTGFDLSKSTAPRTEKDGVQTSRDALMESGDDALMDFATYTESAKITSTYLPFLKEGIEAPINLRPNVLVATGRTSYDGVVQLLPREGGVRECIVARPGYVFASCDYGGLELSTHAQSCLWLVRYSKLAEAINSGVKVHDLFASQMIGMPYEEFLLRAKELTNYRQGAKAANFGFPGGMGAAKLVIQQRAQGQDTVSPNGKKYKGLRFCITLGGQEVCGTEKVREYKKRPLPPTCSKCIAESEILRDRWFKAWPENREYFKYVSEVAELGHMTQHVSKRVRGGVQFSNTANGYFQGLASDGAKLALSRVAREQYTDKSSALYGSRTILFAHDELLCELPESVASDAAKRLEQVMVDSMREYVPDVLVTAEPALMRRWYTGAKPVYDGERLIPWEPIG